MQESALRADPIDVPEGPARTPARQWLSRAFGALLLAAVAWFIVDRAREVQWDAVWQALKGYPIPTLLIALVLATASHALYASYDLLARRCSPRHRIVSKTKVFAVGLVSYAFNLNLGTLVGGLGFRWRLYSRLGLDAAQIGHIFTLSLVANWSGYLLLAGVLLATGSFEPLPQLKLSGELHQLVGLLLLALPIGYVLWCATAKRRSLEFRGHHFDVPPGGIAVMQVALSSTHWMYMGGVIWTLMPSNVSYATVLGTLLSAAIAGVMLHVPGGLGVIEAVFVAALSDQVPEGTLIAALLAYRAAFYLLPLGGATALHFGLEAKARGAERRRREGQHVPGS